MIDELVAPGGNNIQGKARNTLPKCVALVLHLMYCGLNRPFYAPFVKINKPALVDGQCCPNTVA